VGRHLAILVTSMSLAMLVGCRDTARFSNHDDHYEGDVVKGSFVRAGIAEDARMCVTLDADHLQDTPGTLSTSDGRFRDTPLRSIPQIWHDPLSTLTFGDGRRQNLVYFATPVAPAGDTSDIMVVVSLMAEGGLELRLVRGAPQADAGAASPTLPPQADAAPAPTPAPALAQAPPIFAIFTLERRGGTCSF
jgi:hypothetical protein